MRRGNVLAAALVAVFFVSGPAFAGWRLTWQPSGAISLKLVKVPKGDQPVEQLVGIVNPTTGEGRSGNLELRLSGVVVKQFVKPPYYFEFPVDQPIFPDQELRGKIEGQENVAPIMLNDGLDHVFEAWFTVRDNKGRVVRGKQASPTVSFKLDPLAIDPAQVAAAIEQRFNATIEQLKQEMVKQKEEYEAELKRLEAEKKAQQERYEKALEEAKAQSNPSEPKLALRLLRKDKPVVQNEVITVGAEPVELTVEVSPSVKKVRVAASYDGKVFSQKEYPKLQKLVLRMAADGKGGLVPLDPGDPPYQFRVEAEDEAGKRETVSFSVFVQNPQKKGVG